MFVFFSHTGLSLHMAHELDIQMYIEALVHFTEPLSNPPEPRARPKMKHKTTQFHHFGKETEEKKVCEQN